MSDRQETQRKRLMRIAASTFVLAGWSCAGGAAVAGEAISSNRGAAVIGGQYAQAQPAPPDAARPAAPAAPAAPAQPPAKSPTPTETPAVVMNGQQVVSILGKKVRGAGGDDMGRIVDILADKSGQLRAAIIDFGGFLGVGTRQIAVDWKAIRFPAGDKTDSVEVDLTRDQLRVAPVYKPGEQIVVLGQPSTTGMQKPNAAQPNADAASAPAKAQPPNQPSDK